MWSLPKEADYRIINIIISCPVGNSIFPDNVYICFLLLFSLFWLCCMACGILVQPGSNPHGLNHSLDHQGHPCLYLLLYLIYMVKEKGAYICESLNSLILSLSAFFYLHMQFGRSFSFCFSSSAHENEL